MKFEYHRLLMCAGSMLLAIGLLGVAFGIVQGAGSLTRVTIASSANRDSGFPSVNADGTKVVFTSDSDFFNQGIGTLETEIWLYDTKTITFTRLTTKAGSGFRQSLLPSISADGTKVAFQSDSDFLGQGIQSLNYEVWLYDATTMIFTRVTTSPDRQFDLLTPKISADGRKIVFQSDSDFFGQGIQPSQEEIWLYDTQAMTFTRLTTASHPNRRSQYPTLTADGTKVTFDSDSDFLGSGIPDDQFEVWLYDTETMSLARITTASHPNRYSGVSVINAAGTKLVFQSDSDFLGQDIPDNQTEIWLYDIATKAFTRITTASDGNRDSYGASISADGKKIAFTSDSDFLGQGIPDGQEEIWLYNTATMTLTRITTASSPFRDSSTASLSADDTTIAFNSESDFFSQGVLTDQLEIWLYDDIPPILPHLSLTIVDTPDPVVAGQYLTYTITITNNGLADANDVIISDTLDNNVSFISASGGGTHNTGVITWNVGDFTQGQTITRTFIVTVGNLSNGSLLNNIVGVTSREGANSFQTITTMVVIDPLQQIYLPTVLK